LGSEDVSRFSLCTGRAPAGFRYSSLGLVEGPFRGGPPSGALTAAAHPP
jgi:hypothetical protein